MNRLCAGLFCAFCIINVAGIADAAAKQKTAIRPAAGRYQLFQGEYTSYDLKRQQTANVSAVFVIDTATGMVKRYVNKIDENGNFTETWVSTDHASPQHVRKK
ncbi:MAG TPA: hypothetical protein PLN25_03485 [Deltaproteobacteria bacterium]|nr:hypothetical protein [Deltaproteobacteria bacterium]HQB38864.1 hypothetical protein [Deltaproteobacteria bacterium]